MRPVIGVTCGYNEEKSRVHCSSGYYEGIVKAGGLPVLLPPAEDTDILDEYIGRCDGLMLIGGPDADPRHYGEHNLAFNGEICPTRDNAELYLARKAFGLGKPVFGICRGIQVMNIALGGTLYQDIGSQHKSDEVLKHSQSAPVWYPTHEITALEGSNVFRSMGETRFFVNSFHHQAVKNVAPGFKVTASAPDGVIEAIEHVEHPFAVGVQWHPELMWKKDSRFIKLFQMFVKHSGCRTA